MPQNLYNTDDFLSPFPPSEMKKLKDRAKKDNETPLSDDIKITNKKEAGEAILLWDSLYFSQFDFPLQLEYCAILINKCRKLGVAPSPYWLSKNRLKINSKEEAQDVYEIFDSLEIESYTVRTQVQMCEYFIDQCEYYGVEPRKSWYNYLDQEIEEQQMLNEVEYAE